MDIFFSIKRAPQESYSRQLDHEVASQEYPYGVPFEDCFLENQTRIRDVEYEDRKGREKGKSHYGK